MKRKIMGEGKFRNVGSFPGNDKWTESNQRQTELYHRADDIRTQYLRDYNRILHCTAYRRLKHKTQVFFATGNDHICTRIEHVNHVASVSYTISKYLGLNTELTRAISIGHDLGHTPFGHDGEKILKKIAFNKLDETFWHEKNSLWFVDKLETLADPEGKHKNLNLTYAVRDGIVSHCGEVDENALFPRHENIDLNEIKKPSQFSPYTWEGCVVKIADKISYLGRDIEDALRINILSDSQLRQLKQIIKDIVKIDLEVRELNNTVLMHDFIIDLCNSSSPENGIQFSEKFLQLMNSVKNFNYENIYTHPRMDYFRRYAELIIESIFKQLLNFYDGRNTLQQIRGFADYPMLLTSFADWLIKYTDIDLQQKQNRQYANEIVYSIDNQNDYIRAIIDFISGMTDSYTIKIFEELIRF